MNSNADENGTENFLLVYEKSLVIANRKYTVFRRKSASIFWDESARREGSSGRIREKFEIPPFKNSFLVFSE
jgi:hypothetical protein